MTQPAPVSQPQLPAPEGPATQSYADLWRLIKLSEPSGVLLGLATLSALIAAAGTLWFPMLAKQLIDQLGSGKPSWNAVALLVGVLVVASIISAVSNYLLSLVGLDVVAVLRNALVSKQLRLPVAKFEQHDTGDRVSRVVSDCGSISMLVTAGVVNLLGAALVLVGSIVFLLLLDTRLTLTLLASIGVAFAVILPTGFLLNRLSQQVQDRTAKLGGVLTQVFSEIRLVKAFTAEEREGIRGREQINDLRRLGLRVAKINVALEPIMGLAVVAAVVIILVYGASRVSSGSIGVGTLTAFILYIFNIVTPLGQLTAFATELQKARGASSRISAILQEDDEELNPGKELESQRGVLEFRNVSFSYGGQKIPVLRGVDLIFKPGTTTALVGISGSGKTTILSLIERFYDPSSGDILHNGRPISEYSLAAWRRSIGYVAQSAPIMPGSVRDNIVYGLSETFSDEAVRLAAARAGALSFIESMPNGFDTILIEQGNNVSGGQRQRLAIARMFLRDPDILILDEATSNLDSETEHQVKAALEELMQGRTNIIVAHRLFTVMHTDCIYFLEEGRISGTGKHSELIDTHAYYARLVEHQFQKSPAMAELEGKR